MICFESLQQWPRGNYVLGLIVFFENLPPRHTTLHFTKEELVDFGKDLTFAITQQLNLEALPPPPKKTAITERYQHVNYGLREDGTFGVATAENPPMTEETARARGLVKG